jgi:hypothetical protein
MRIVDKKIIYPAAFNSKTIREHPAYENDLKDLIEKSGAKDRFLGLYKQRLNYLDKHGALCILKRDWFEQLKWFDEELFSMLLKFQKNIRIIFSFVDYQGTQYALLLYPFQEKESGKNKNSYRAAAAVALKRLEEIREGLKNV